MKNLFDADEFIDPDAITRSLEQMRSQSLQQPTAQQPAQKPQLPAESVVQAPNQQNNNGDGGLLGTILSIFM